MDRKEHGEILYREKFNDAGLSNSFDFISRDWSSDHGRKVFVKCKSCGHTFSTWAINEISKGNIDYLRCPECGVSSDGQHDRFSKSEAFDQMRQFYESGHSVRETSEKFKISTWNVNDYVKRFGWTNGINWRDAAEANNKKRSDEAEQRLSQRLDSLGFEYIDGYESKNSTIRIKCKVCGTIKSIRYDSITDNICCIECRKEQTRQHQEVRKIEYQWHSAIVRAERQKVKAEQKAEQQKIEDKKRSEYLNAKTHTCEICGKKFSIAEYMNRCGLREVQNNPRYCSKECKVVARNQKVKEYKKSIGYNDKTLMHRARHYGAKRVSGWDWKRVAKRDGMRCAICGGICDPNDLYIKNGYKICGPNYPTLDHIIALADGGSHTPDNFQLAHHYCNSKKGANKCGRPRKEAVNE